MRKNEKFNFYAFKLSGIMILVFILQVLFSGFTELFLLTPAAWGEWWRFLTAIFLHGGLGHILYNLFALVLFGSILERIVGGRRFLTVFFVTGILANIISVNFYGSSLGASGAIFGVIGALLFIRPLLPVWAFGMPLPLIVAGVIWAAGDVLGAIGFFAGNPIDDTGNLAHLSGMAFGLLLGWVYRKEEKKLKKARHARMQKHVKNPEKGLLH